MNQAQHAFLTALALLCALLVSAPATAWTNELQEGELTDTEVQEPTADLLNPIFAPLANRKDVSLLNRMHCVQQDEQALHQAIQEAAEAEAVGEVMQLNPQTEAEFVVFHPDGSVEFRNEPAPQQTTSFHLLKGPTTANGQNNTTSGWMPNLLTEEAYDAPFLDDPAYAMFLSPTSATSYDTTVESKLTDPESHTLLPGFSRAFSALANPDSPFNAGSSRPGEADTLSESPFQEGGQNGKKKNKPQKAKGPAQRIPSPPLPTIESLHITKLPRIQAEMPTQTETVRTEQENTGTENLADGPSDEASGLMFKAYIAPEAHIAPRPKPVHVFETKAVNSPSEEDLTPITLQNTPDSVEPATNNLKPANTWHIEAHIAPFPKQVIPADILGALQPTEGAEPLEAPQEELPVSLPAVVQETPSASSSNIVPTAPAESEPVPVPNTPVTAPEETATPTPPMPSPTQQDDLRDLIQRLEAPTGP